jgi:hypothetical protein
VSGLGANDLYVFANYSSLTGAWTFAGGPGGLFKFANANPNDYIQLYSIADFFCGFPLIDKARMYLWGIAKDPTSLYRSYIDVQRDGTSFTQVSNENLASGNGSQTTFSGTLVFKSGQPKRNCGLVTVKCTDASLRYNFEKTMLFVDAGFHDPGYLKDILGWLFQDAEDTKKDENNSTRVQLRKDMADAMRKIRRLLGSNQ